MRINKKCCGLALLLVALAGCARQGTLKVYQEGKLIDERTVYGPAAVGLTQYAQYQFLASKPMDMPGKIVTYIGTGASFVLEQER